MLDTPRNLIKNSPVTSLTTAESVVAAVLTYLATHGVLGDIDVSTTTQTIAPFVALAIPAVFGAAKWSLVTPFAKVKDMAERDGLVSDADFARLGALLDEKLQDLGYDATGADTAEEDAEVEEEEDADVEDFAEEEDDDSDGVLEIETEDDAPAPAAASESFDTDLLPVHHPEHSAPEDADPDDEQPPLPQAPQGAAAGAP